MLQKNSLTAMTAVIFAALAPAVFAIPLSAPIAAGVSAPAARDAVKVFPGAMGFGTDTPAGSGRNLSRPHSRLYVVTNLNDSGLGSLRDAIARDGPRTVVFAVSGSIKLESPLLIRNPYLTIAGETAPAPGIAIINDRAAVMTHDVLIRHVRFFVGDIPGKTKGADRDALGIIGEKGMRAARVVVDHCYLGGALDENFSTYGNVSDVTISNSIIADSLDQPISSAAHEKGHHGKGILIGDDTKNFSIIRCLLANNQDRNPRLKHGSEGEMINTVVYGWGGESGWNVLNVSDPGREAKNPVLMNVIGNTYLPGPEGRCDIPFAYAKDIIPGSKLFMLDNKGPACEQKDDGKKRNEPEQLAPKFIAERHPLPLSPDLTILPRQEAMEFVFSHAGPRPAERYRDDERLIKEVRERTGRIKAGIWGFERKDIDFPELASTRRELALPKDPDKTMPDGRTALEHWIETYADKVEKAR